MSVPSPERQKLIGTLRRTLGVAGVIGVGALAYAGATRGAASSGPTAGGSTFEDDLAGARRSSRDAVTPAIPSNGFRGLRVAGTPAAPTAPVTAVAPVASNGGRLVSAADARDGSRDRPRTARTPAPFDPNATHWDPVAEAEGRNEEPVVSARTGRSAPSRTPAPFDPNATHWDPVAEAEGRDEEPVVSARTGRSAPSRTTQRPSPRSSEPSHRTDDRSSAERVGDVARRTEERIYDTGRTVDDARDIAGAVEGNGRGALSRAATVADRIGNIARRIRRPR